MFFPYFHVVRNALTSYLITIFALFFPFLNSIKAVVANDIEGMREFLTYWCVLIVITYVEQLLRLLNWSKNNQYPPEIQLIVILWLTLPQFQGAYRIYVLIIKPYFERYETDIDKQFDTIATTVKARANRHIQLILWQLFLAPNDGILSLTMSAAAQSIYSVINTSDKAAVATNLTATKEEVTQPVVKLKLSEQILNNFTLMLNEGLYIYTSFYGDNNRDSTSNIIKSINTMHMATYKLSLINNNKSLLFTAVAATGSTTDPASHDHTFQCKVIYIDSVASDLDKEDIIIITLVDEVTCNIHVSIQEIYMKTHNEEDGEAIVAGLSLLAMDTKAKYTRHVRKVDDFTKRSRLARAYSKWKEAIQQTAASESERVSEQVSEQVSELVSE